MSNVIITTDTRVTFALESDRSYSIHVNGLELGSYYKGKGVVFQSSEGSTISTKEIRSIIDIIKTIEDDQ